MKNQKGITLVALVITIIVMLILVAVSLTVAINNGLIGNAQKAATDTQTERDAEKKISDGYVKIDGQGEVKITPDGISTPQTSSEGSEGQASDQGSDQGSGN